MQIAIRKLLEFATFLSNITLSFLFVAKVPHKLCVCLQLALVIVKFEKHVSSCLSWRIESLARMIKPRNGPFMYTSSSGFLNILFFSNTPIMILIIYYVRVRRRNLAIVSLRSGIYHKYLNETYILCVVLKHFFLLAFSHCKHFYKKANE